MLLPPAAVAASSLLLTVDRVHLKIHVNVDGSSVTEQIEETTLLIETGIDSYGDKRVSFCSTRETVEVLNAHAVPVDGIPIPVYSHAIRLVVDRLSAVCQPGDEKPFNEMLPVIQCDLWGHIFYE
jgi:hypothetical protein